MFIQILYIIIIFIIILILVNPIKNYYKHFFSSPDSRIINNFGKKFRIAIYSYNFGNYRNEINSSIDNFIPYKEIDYYFYSDKNLSQLKNWKTLKVPLQPRTKHMNSNRVTTKYYKFKYLPSELKKYDYLIHIDSSRINYLNKFTYDDILKLIYDNKNKGFICKKHKFLGNIYEEADHLIKKGNKENKDNVLKWINKLKKENFYQNLEHLELCFFIRNLKDEKLTKLMSKVYDTLMKNKLCRDQLIFLYVLQKNNYNKIKSIQL